MSEMVQLLTLHGYWFLFAALFARQACLPVPADLLLLVAGALAGLGRLSFVGILAFAVLALLLADWGWYESGRKWGGKALHFICGAARDPEFCKRKITRSFERHGVKSLLFSKFILGLDSVAAPMTGLSKTERPRFLVFDAIGAILWSSAYATLGYFLKDQLGHVVAYSNQLGTLALLALMAGVGVFMTRKFPSLRSICPQIQANVDHAR
jgi:membrane protein DedA with SNARE-associated domain